MTGITYQESFARLERCRKEMEGLLKRIDGLVRERNRLEKQVRIRDEVILEYRHWFEKHKHIISSEQQEL